MDNVYLMNGTDEESVDMDELTRQEEGVEEDADKEPDSEILSTDEDEVEEVEGEEPDESLDEA